MASTKDRIHDAKPYVERALKDEDLRDNLQTAFSAARDLYSELIGGRGAAVTVASRVATDKDVQENLKKIVDELREASERVQGKKDHGTRNTMLLLIGITLGILFNPMTGGSTRDWLKNRLFGGGGDDFTYGGGSSGNSGGGDTGATGGGNGTP